MTRTKTSGSAFVILIVILTFGLAFAVYTANPGDFFVQKPEGFTEAKFRAVKEGMSFEEVQALVGDPVHIEELEGGDRLLLYAKPWPGVFFYSGYEIYLSREGLVTRKYIEF